MKSKHCLGVMVGVFGFGALAGSGCGSKDDAGATGAGGGTTTAASSTIASVSSVSSTKASSSSGMMTTNHSFEMATDIAVNDPPTADVLVDVSTPNFYKFTGKTGQRITIGATAQSLAGADGDDGSVIDTVVTIYDAKKVQIAQNDDAFPRFGRDSQVFTILVADGDYYIKVNECNAVFPGGCDEPSSVGTFDFELFVADVDQLVAPEVNEGMADNDAQAGAVAISYKVPSGSMAGNYGTYIIDGGFSSGTDVDFFTFTPPGDTTVDPAQRPHAEFWVQPISNKGTGSTSNVVVQVVNDKGEVLAEADQTNYGQLNTNNGPISLSVPVALNTKYFLTLKPSGMATKPVSDFYFVEHFVGSFYYGTLETSDMTNNLPETAEKLAKPAMIAGTAYFVDGEITTAGVDVDWYTMDVAGMPKASLYCDAQRAGSGLRGAKFGLYTPGAIPTKIGEISEVANLDAQLADDQAVAVPGGTTQLLLKAEAVSQEEKVAGKYYRCVVTLDQ